MTTTPNIGLTKPANGDNPGNWDVPANANYDIIDNKFDDTSDLINGTGHIHDGTAGQGPQIDHADLLNTGTNTHAQIDTHLANSGIHFLASTVQIRVNDKNSAGVAGTGDNVAAVTELRFPNATVTETSSGSKIVVIETFPVDGGTTQPEILYRPALTAPVAVTDYFTGPIGSTLNQANWFTAGTPGRYFTDSDQYAQLAIPSGAGVGYSINRVKTQVPHSHVQRVTLNVSELLTKHIEKDSDYISFRLALMSSTLGFGAAASCIPGIYLDVRVYRLVTGIQVVKQIYGELPDASGTPIRTIWWTSAPVTLSEVSLNTGGYLGSHELSLDRNGIFYYVYNNGPVDIGAAASSGTSVLAFVGSLKTYLTAERETTAYSGATSVIATSPAYGRFGFDLFWDLRQSDKLVSKVQFFTAASTEDDPDAYTVIKSPEELPYEDNTPTLPIGPPPPLVEPCCTAGSFSGLLPGAIIPIANPAGTAGETEYRIQSKISEGDVDYVWAGFLVQRAYAPFPDPNPTYPIYCSTMGALRVKSAVIAMGEPCRVVIAGSRIPGLVDVQFYTMNTTSNLSNPPAGSLSKPRPFAYPLPDRPGEISSEYPITSPGTWPTNLEFDNRIVRNVAFAKEGPDLVVTFDLAEGLTYGTAVNITVTSRADSLNTQTITQAFVIPPPKPVWIQSAFYSRSSDGTFTPTSTITAGSDLYVVAYGRNLPLPTNNSVPTANWSGYPFDLSSATLTGKYKIIDYTGSTAYASISEFTAYRGKYMGTLTNKFNTSGMTAAEPDGETVFAKISFNLSSEGKALTFQACQLSDPAVPVANLPLPSVGNAVPVIYQIIPSSTQQNTSVKTIQVIGANFIAPTISVANATSVTTPVLTGSTLITFTCVTNTVAAVTVTITNVPSGEDVSGSWVVANTYTPAGVSVSPSTITEYTAVQVITVSVTSGLSAGAVVQISPSGSGLMSTQALNISNPATGQGSITAVLLSPVPASPGPGYSLTVLNPNGNVSTAVTLTVQAASAVTITDLDFYTVTPNAYATTYGTGNYPNPVLGDTGFIKITGTNFRSGSTVNISINGTQISSQVATYVSATQLKVPYDVPLYIPAIGLNYVVEVVDLNPANTDDFTITIAEPRPVITAVDIMDPTEGAGSVYASAGSAKVRIYGSNLDQVTPSTGITVSGTGSSSAVSINSFTIESDTLITIDTLTIPPACDGEDITITLDSATHTVSAKTFAVEPYKAPVITGHRLLDSGGNEVTHIFEGDTGLTLEVYGYNLANTAATIYSESLNTSSSDTTPSPSDTALTFAIGDVDTPLSATSDRRMYLLMNLPGASASTTITPGSEDFSFELPYVVEPVSGGITITGFSPTNIYDGSVSGYLILSGTNLNAANVSGIRVTPKPGVTAASLYSVQSFPISQITIISQSASQIAASVNLGQFVYGADATGALLEYQLELLDREGAVAYTLAQTFPILPRLNAPHIGTGLFGETFGFPTLSSTTGGDTVTLQYTFTNITQIPSVRVFRTLGATIRQDITDTAVSNGAVVSGTVTYEFDVTLPAAGNLCEIVLIGSAADGYAFLGATIFETI